MDDEVLPTTANASAQSFDQLCHELRPGGPAAYSYRRIMSHLGGR